MLKLSGLWYILLIQTFVIGGIIFPAGVVIIVEALTYNKNRFFRI